MLIRFILILLLVAILGGGAFLMTFDMPAPVRSVEKVVPNDKLVR
ncbi:hypothetical protein GCM10011505_11130 [Tistrella bauzanensis]|uniref:Histidine kinase n=1 Tax=Tistrella bauzanensis TaxID=657419 RepID=A0ABQ1IBF7_9PROT|nr:hypothetical protein [Tistrella bauzanensis]GGB31459.1 hypothetical protein GCM10011505_11130 [Tistrella bauzanensis]